VHALADSIDSPREIGLVPPRETREGWSLLIVETEVNGNSKSTNKEVLPWLVRWARHTGTRDFYPAFDALVSTVQNIKDVDTGQADVQGRLSLSMCLRSHPSP
jgi:hypothetical protein